MSNPIEWVEGTGYPAGHLVTYQSKTWRALAFSRSVAPAPEAVTHGQDNPDECVPAWVEVTNA